MDVKAFEGSRVRVFGCSGGRGRAVELPNPASERETSEHPNAFDQRGISMVEG
jgi:hypothetical protein